MQNELIFGEHGLTTIFDGEVVPQLNRNGTVNHYRARGFRYEDVSLMLASGCSILEESRRVPDSRGVYRAAVVIKGVGRSQVKSNFFPQTMTRAEVVQAISDAYAGRELIHRGERLYKGESANLTILMWLDDRGLIVDAMPKAARHNSKVKQAIFRFQHTGKRSKILCHVCHEPKIRICPNGHGGIPDRGLYNGIKPGWRRRLLYLVRGLLRV